MPALPVVCWNIILDYAETDTTFLRGRHKGMELLINILNKKCQDFGLETRTAKEWSSAFSGWKSDVRKRHSEKSKLQPHENRYIQLCIRHGISVEVLSKMVAQNNSTGVCTPQTPKVEEPESKKIKCSPNIFLNLFNEVHKKDLEEYLELQKEVIRLNKNCDFIALTEKIVELNDLMEDEDSSRLEKCLSIIKHFIQIERE